MSIKCINKNVDGKLLTTRCCIITALALIVAACANNPLSSYKSNMDKPLQQLKDGNLNQAESTVVNSNQMLYYLEQATILRLSDQYKQSNDIFTSAQAVIDAWISSYKNGTLGRASDTLTVSLINDRAIDYIPKDYEKVMLPTYKALNYIALANLADARIEITRMYNIEDIIQNYRAMQYAKLEQDSQANTTTIQKYQDLSQVENQTQGQYDFSTLNSPAVLALKNSYQNAFSHYLAGFLFEALAEPSLARPGYLKALQLNPNNALIETSIANIDRGTNVDTATTDLLVVEEVGHAPQFKSVSFPIKFNAQAGQNSCMHAITIAFPELKPDTTKYTNVGVNIDNISQHLTMLTDFNLMAARYLHDDLPDIFLHNILRASKDMALQQSSCNNGGSVAGMLAAFSGIFLGEADERTWTTLPEKIYVTRLKLKRGKHMLQVNNAGTTRNLEINLTKSHTVVSFRVIGSSVYFSPEQNTHINCSYKN